MTQIYTVTLNPGLDRTLTVPSLVFNEVLRASESRLDWGGKGFNVSRALRALDAESVAMGFVGGSTGQMLERGLRELGISTDFFHIEGETRTNTVIAEADSERYIKVNEAGPLVDSRAVTALFARVRERAKADSIWVLSGSLPPGAPIDVYAQLIALIHERGGRSCLDTSGSALRAGIAARPYLVKPNELEAEQVLGRPVVSEVDRLQAVEFFLDQGVDLVALSLGADGLMLGARDQIIHARPPSVPVRTLVGVGDALLAGIVWALQQEMSFADVARWGVAAGTAAAMHNGVSVASKAEVEAVAERVSFA